MKQELLNISNRIDSLTREALTLISTFADKLKIETFIIGTTAIDILFSKIYDIKIHRITNDIDFSVRVKDWDAYTKLIKSLTNSGFESSNIIHRFNYKNIPSIDIIPFGKISLPKLEITWPDKEQKEMSVMGYEESFNDSLLVRINNSPILDVKISSIRGLVLLKLVSWKDGFPSRSRDAIDILYIIQNYIEAGNEDRLYNENNDLITDDFDFELTGAILLGRDIKAFANKTTLEFIIDLISSELKNPSESQFIKDMLKDSYTLSAFENKFEHCVKLMSNLLKGLQS